MSMIGTPSSLKPAWLPPKGTIERLRQRRRAITVARKLFAGQWKSVLLDMDRTQFRFKEAKNHSGRVGKLLVKINLIKVAMLMHGGVLGHREPLIDLPEEFAGQWEAIDQIRDRSLFAALWQECATKVAIEGEAAIRVDIVTTHGDTGAALIVEPNDQCFPMDQAAPDRQPTVWERRWIIEREIGSEKKTRLYLRVERYRVDPALGGVIENELYETDSRDTLVDLDKLKRVRMEIAGVSAEERRLTNLDRNPIFQIVGMRVDGHPSPLIDERDMDLIDVTAKSFSDLVRVHAMHASPKMRGPESMIDRKTGVLQTDADFLVDPNQEVEYIRLESQLDQMLTMMERCAQWMMVELQMSQALIGFKVGGGSAAETYEKLLLDATPTLARALTAAAYADPALSRAMTIACRMDSAIPMRGYDTHPVSVQTRPEIPRDNTQRVRELAERMASGLISEIDALEDLYGPRRAAAMAERIQEDRKAKAERDSLALSAALPSIGGDPTAPSNDPAGDPAQQAASGNEGVAPTADRLTGIDAERAAAMLHQVSTKEQAGEVVLGLLISMGIPEERAREMVSSASQFSPVDPVTTKESP